MTRLVSLDEETLEGIGLLRTRALDPAPPPGPVARLAGHLLIDFPDLILEHTDYQIATWALPTGNGRADVGRTLTPRWLLIARAAASLATEVIVPSRRLDRAERTSAAVLAVALAALAAPHDTYGWTSMTGISDYLLEISYKKSFPAGIRRMAREVALGLIDAGSPADEKALVRGLTEHEQPFVEAGTAAPAGVSTEEILPESSAGTAPSNPPGVTTGLDALPPFAYVFDEASGTLLVNGVPVVTGLRGLSARLVGKLIATPAGFDGGKALGRALEVTPETARGVYARLKPMLVARGMCLLDSLEGRYGLRRDGGDVARQS